VAAHHRGSRRPLFGRQIGCADRHPFASATRDDRHPQFANAARVRSNYDIFGFALIDTDMSAIAAPVRDGRTASIRTPTISQVYRGHAHEPAL
jgi:hypothetical protein